MPSSGAGLQRDGLRGGRRARSPRKLWRPIRYAMSGAALACGHWVVVAHGEVRMASPSPPACRTPSWEGQGALGFGPACYPPGRDRGEGLNAKTYFLPIFYLFLGSFWYIFEILRIFYRFLVFL